MSTLNRWFDRLQLSPRSQRVLTEAALDWRHEVAGVSSWNDTSLAHCRGFWGMSRLMGTVAIDSAAPAFHQAWLVRLAICSALVAISSQRIDMFLIFMAACAVPLAVLFGPADRRSAAFGFGWIQVLACAAVALVRPATSAGLLIQVCACALIASAVADRVRTDAHRERTTLQVFGTLIVVWIVAFSFIPGLRVNGVAEPAIERAFGGYVAVSLAAIWWWLVRRQETRQWWDHVQLWLKYRAEQRS